MADDEEDDPVVEEIDVYLAKNIIENLYLFQYLSRPAAITYDKTTCLAARVKPQQKKVMLEMSLNTSGPYYCQSKGEELAFEADHAAPDDKKFFKSDTMDKQILLSSQGTRSTSQYAVGFLKDGEIHLTPFTGVVQLRPNFEYLDRGKERKASTADEAESQDEDEEKPAALMVRFAKKESEQAKAQRLLSFKHLEKQMAEEQWTDVDFYGKNHAKSVDERDLLFCQEMNTEVLEFCPSSSNYVERLMPSAADVPSASSPLPNSVNIMAHVRKLDMIDQVKTLLIQAKLMSFSEICNVLHPPANEQTVLKCLQQHAVLVQGSWVVKSELLYPKGMKSAFSSSTSETLCKARDYILYKFTKSRTLQRNNIISDVKLTVDDVNDIIQQVAIKNDAVGWEFKLPYNKDFVQRFGDVVKQQTSFWTTKYRTLCEKYNLPREEEIKDDIKMKSPSHSTPPNVSRSINTSMLSNSTPETRMDTHVSNGYIETSGKNETEISPETEEKLFNRLVKFVKDKLNTSTLSLADLKKLLLLQPTGGSPEEFLTGVSDSLLLKAIVKCGGEEIDLKWPATSQYPADLNSRRIFVIRTLGSPLDKYRSVILDLFHGAFAVQRKMIVEKSKQMLGNTPTTTEYNKVIQELGLERKGASWFIRGTQSVSSTR